MYVWYGQLTYKCIYLGISEIAQQTLNMQNFQLTKLLHEISEIDGLTKILKLQFLKLLTQYVNPRCQYFYNSWECELEILLMILRYKMQEERRVFTSILHTNHSFHNLLLNLSPTLKNHCFKTYDESLIVGRVQNYTPQFHSYIFQNTLIVSSVIAPFFW